MRFLCGGLVIRPVRPGKEFGAVQARREPSGRSQRIVPSLQRIVPSFLSHARMSSVGWAGEV